MTEDAAQPQGRVLSLPQTPDAIELRHLRAFVAVADELNFGRAAGRLYLSQPALSRQIRALERLVGCELLRRSTHRVELTLAGEALLDRARRILAELDEAVSATRSVGGELVGRATRLWEPLVDLSTTVTDLPELRAAYEALHAQFSAPPEVAVRPANAGGVPALLLTPGPEPPATLMYLHGGGNVTGSAFGYQPLAGALAAAADACTLVPDFRLAPEHPFPAAVEDALAAYRWLLDSGTEPQRVTLAGDSAGAGLVLSLLVTLDRRDLPMPGGAVLFCPGYDLTCSVPHRIPDQPQPVDHLEVRRQYASYYLAGHPADDPLVNPLAADLSALPPMLIQGATGDPAVEEAHRLADHARQQGVDVRLELYPVSTHVFHIFWSFLPEAADAVHQAGEFARDVAAGGPARRVATGR